MNLKIVSKNRKNLWAFLLWLLIFLIPSNLFYKFMEEVAFVNGLKIDYLIPKLYLSDLVIGAIFLVYFFTNKIKLKKNIVLVSVFLGVIFIRQFFVSHPVSALWFLAKILEMTLLFWLLPKGLIAVKKPEKIIWPAILSVLGFQSLLAIYQFIYQRSLFGYYFLGEVDLSRGFGLAKSIFSGQELLLPYGTTAHPNILAGVLAIFLLISIYYLKIFWRDKNFLLLKTVSLSILPISALALFFTQSFSAWLTFVFGLILLILKKNKFFKTSLPIIITLIFLLSPLITTIVNNNHNPSIYRRNYLNFASIKMLKENLFGVGLNNFTARVEEFSPAREVVRFSQPTHHVPLLISAELGLILSLILLILIWPKIKDHSGILPAIFVLSPVLALDHYLYTNQSGMLLLVLTFVFFSVYE